MSSSVDSNAVFALAHKVQKELDGASSQFKEVSDKFVTLIIYFVSTDADYSIP